MRTLKKQAVAIAVAVAMGAMAESAMAVEVHYYAQTDGSWDASEQGPSNRKGVWDSTHWNGLSGINGSGGVDSGHTLILCGGYANQGDAKNNTVTVSGGKVNIVYGANVPESAFFNTVNIDGGTVKSVIAGENMAIGQGNAVIWCSGTISDNLQGEDGGDNSSDNTLVIIGSGTSNNTSPNKSVCNVSGFQNYVFALDESTNTDTPLLTVTNALTLNSTDKVGLTIKRNASVNLEEGNTVTLMKVTGGINGYNNISKSNQLDAIVTELRDGNGALNSNLGNTYAAQWIKDNTEVVTAGSTALESKVNNYTFALDTTATELTATVTDVTPTIVVTDVRQIADSNYVNFRSQMNDVSLRMGELRCSNSDGGWARLYGGQYKLGTGMKEKSVSIQIGADKWFNANSYIGLTGSYTKADDTLTQGDNKQKNWNVGIYGGYLADNGLFVDAIVKHGQLRNDFSLQYESGEPSAGKYHMNGTSVSVEGGWRFNCPNTGFYAEPQVELAYGHIQSADFTAGEVNFEHESVDALVGRVGVATGYKFLEDRGNAYFRASLLHEFKGEVKTRATSGAETDGGSLRDFSGTWGEFALGGTYKATKNLNLYGELMCSTKNAGVKTKWQGSTGARWIF